MKKVLVIVLSFLLAVKANYAQALEPQCNALGEIQPKIIEIQNFASITKMLSADEYSKILKKLTEDTNSIALKAVGCDPYSDNLVAQMHGALTKLNENAAKFRKS